MQYRVYFILLLGIVTNKGQKLSCLSFEEKDNKNELLKAYGLSSNILDDLSNFTEWGIGKYKSTFIDRHNHYFEIIRYKKTNSVIEAQFELHVHLIKNLDMEIFLSHKFYCVIEKDFAYLIYRKPRLTSKVIDKFPYFRIERMNELFSKIVRMLRRFEEEGAVFTQTVEDFFLPERLDIEFNPDDLKFVYPINGKSYIDSQTWPIQTDFEEALKQGIPDQEAALYVAVPSDKTWNIYFLLSSIEALSQKRVQSSTEIGRNIDVWNQFLEILRLLMKQVNGSQAINHSRAEVEEVINNLGYKDIIAQKLQTLKTYSVSANSSQARTSKDKNVKGTSPSRVDKSSSQNSDLHSQLSNITISHQYYPGRNSKNRRRSRSNHSRSSSS